MNCIKSFRLVLFVSGSSDEHKGYLRSFASWHKCTFLTTTAPWWRYPWGYLDLGSSIFAHCIDISIAVNKHNPTQRAITIVLPEWTHTPLIIINHKFVVGNLLSKYYQKVLSGSGSTKSMLRRQVVRVCTHLSTVEIKMQRSTQDWLYLLILICLLLVLLLYLSLDHIESAILC